MIIHIANPIYDSVFKYLMEDERIAKTLLSALLKKEVVSIEARPHEYSNQTRDKISMFRIDFSARVREADSSEHLILVELQKTWLETETLRFRQYLGAQYSDKRNIRKDTHDGFALPMVTIYILGHKIGDVDVPVVYVNHKSYDYDGNEVTKGMPDPFIESLVHNSIIVQIPLLHGQINNRLDKVLSVFDQTRVDAYDHHVLSLEESTYEGDENMEYMVRRLTQAAADSEMRQNMNVEDEYFSAIEDRDTAIMNRDNAIKERDNTIKERDNTIKERDNTIKERENTIKERDNTIKERNNTIKKLDDELAEKNAQIRSIAQAMKDTGMSVEQISKIIGKGTDEVKALLEAYKDE